MRSASDPPPAAVRPRDWRAATIGAAVALLALFWWQALSASREWSQTSDELPHIAAGYAYDARQDFRLQPENGVLPQRVQGLAPLALHARFPTDEVYWQESQVWQLGWDLFYSLGNPTDQIVQDARALNTLFGVGLGCFILIVAWRWSGPLAGLVALGLFAFCPAFLFHSAQATSDLAGVLFLTLAGAGFWWHLARRTTGSALLAGLLAGLALTAKFSGLLLVPIGAILLVADPPLRTPAGRGPGRLWANLLHGLVVGAVAWVVIWAFYDFRFAARAPGMPDLRHFSWPWNPALRFAGWKGAVLSWALSWHLLPEAFLRGLDYVFASGAARPAFFAGQYSQHGWLEFFPALFLFKTPLAVLAGTAVAAGAAAGRMRRMAGTDLRSTWNRWLPLILVGGITMGAAMTGGLDIGHRHILAVYPPLFIAIGSLAGRTGRWRLAPLLLVALQVMESVSIRPHYLAYFNPLAGGPARAYRLVVDSSLDWGQDLPALRAWLAVNRRPGEKFYLSYFGSAWPPHYLVRPTRFLPSTNVVHPPPERFPYEPGLYCLSATSLAEVYSPYRGPWRPEWEARLQVAAPDTREFQELRFARLCKYLQHRRPDAEAGYSILIFRLDARDLQDALTGPVTGW